MKYVHGFVPVPLGAGEPASCAKVALQSDVMRNVKQFLFTSSTFTRSRDEHARSRFGLVYNRWNKRDLIEESIFMLHCFRTTS